VCVSPTGVRIEHNKQREEYNRKFGEIGQFMSAAPEDPFRGDENGKPTLIVRACLRNIKTFLKLFSNAQRVLLNVSISELMSSDLEYFLIIMDSSYE
jgi:hypothetical protein